MNEAMHDIGPSSIEMSALNLIQIESRINGRRVAITVSAVRAPFPSTEKGSLVALHLQLP
jgi:hypothetical protein